MLPTLILFLSIMFQVQVCSTTPSVLISVQTTQGKPTLILKGILSSIPDLALQENGKFKLKTQKSVLIRIEDNRIPAITIDLLVSKDRDSNTSIRSTLATTGSVEEERRQGVIQTAREVYKLIDTNTLEQNFLSALGVTQFNLLPRSRILKMEINKESIPPEVTLQLMDTKQLDENTLKTVVRDALNQYAEIHKANPYMNAALVLNPESIQGMPTVVKWVSERSSKRIAPETIAWGARGRDIVNFFASLLTVLRGQPNSDRILFDEANAHEFYESTMRDLIN